MCLDGMYVYSNTRNILNVIRYKKYQMKANTIILLFYEADLPSIVVQFIS